MFSVYRLKFSSGHYYLGSSNNVQHRFRKHKRSCLSSKPQNIFMSRCWQKHGEPTMEVLMNFDSEQEMLEYEQVLITKFIEEELNLNINPNADRPPSSIGLKRSSEHKTKISLANKGRIPATQTIAASVKARAIPVQVGEVVYASLAEAERMLGVSNGLVARALRLKIKVKGLEVRRVENVV
jgi:predicted GIY-YIG superfamily endonuclease